MSIQQALTIVANHNAKIWQVETAAELLRLRLESAAAALFRAAVSFTDRAVLRIECTHQKEATTLRKCWRVLIRAAQLERIEELKIGWHGCDRAYPIPVSQSLSLLDQEQTESRLISAANASNLPEPEDQTPPIISSYAPNRIRPEASEEEVDDFIRGKKAEGLIVTITAMKNDKCLKVNDLQAIDRGGGWDAQDWIGIDFKTLWRDSFLRFKPNYYGDLVDRIASERAIEGFYYHIRRPSGALAEYSTDYFFADHFLQGSVRIGVSRVGDWRILEDAADGSETVGASE